MERVDQASVATRERHPGRSAKHEPHRTALVLYGSETGNAQDVAEEVGRLTERQQFDTIVLDLDSVQLRDIVKYTIVLFAVSTTGQGEMPQNARVFWKTLLSSALKPGLLRKVRFASFGLGDSSYPRFNVAHRMLHGRMVQLGAQAFCERGEGNEQHPEGHSAGFREWIVALKQRLLEVFPVPADMNVLPDDAFLEPKWRLELEERLNNSDSIINWDVHGTLSSQNGATNGHEYDHSKGRVASQLPSQDAIPVKGTYTADIKANTRVTTPDHFQDVRLLDLQIGQAYDYGPGAVAVVYPKNFPEDVQSFIDLMGWQDVADCRVFLAPTAPTAHQAGYAPSPLRHLDVSRIDVTLRWLLENVLDLVSIPRRSFFACLAYFAGDGSEDEKYQKERLLELANPELIDELWDYTTRPKRTILEVMLDFTTIKIPWQYALSVLPIMRGRQFSIASGGDLRRDSEGRTKVQLLVAIADPPSPIIKWRRRYGVCTRYIASLQEGQQINIGLQQGYLDVRPSELQVPVVMVGPGTGVAPMRSMIYQRLAWSTGTSTREPGQRLEGDILIFGCRSESADYFFQHEWARLASEEGLTVLTAFSREQSRSKQYVQDQIRANAGKVYDALVRRNGKVYVCGSSGNMPKGVRESLLDVLVEQDPALTGGEAEDYLDRMEKESRYKQETW